MFNLADVHKDDKVRVLAVGPNGSGKSVATASWPGRHLIFDFDKRFSPLIDWYPDKIEKREIDIEVCHASNYWEVFHKKVNELADNNPYQNIHISSITSLSNASIVMQMITRGSLQITKAQMEQAEKSGKGDKIGFKFVKGGVAIPSWDEINGETMLITQLLEVLKSFNCNLFVHAHPLSRMADGKKYDSIVTYGPKVESMIPGYFDEIWYFASRAPMQGTKFNRMMYPRPSIEYPNAKTAIKEMPDEINFTDRRLYDVIKDYL